MAQPVYSFWPWRVLAVGTPFAAALAAGLAVANESQLNQEKELALGFLVFLTLYGAGTGWLVGAAIGDFGRSLMAMLAGAGVALAWCKLMPLELQAIGIFAVIAASCACLPLEPDLEGIFNAALTGFTCFALGLLYGGAVFVLGGVACHMVGANGVLRALLLGVLALAVAQDVFVRRLFKSAQRVEATVQAKEEDQEPARGHPSESPDAAH